MESKEVKVQRLMFTPSEIETLKEARAILNQITRIMAQDGWDLLVDIDGEAMASYGDFEEMDTMFAFLTEKLRIFDLCKDEENEDGEIH